MKRNGLVLLLSGVIVLLGLVTGAAAEEGVTATEIHLGQWGPQTGPAAAWGSVARGTDAYFKMINERGGHSRAQNGTPHVLHCVKTGQNQSRGQ